MAKAVGTRSVVFFGSTPPEFFRFKSNINIEPRFCGGCWWSTESYLRQCPLLEDTPPAPIPSIPKRLPGPSGNYF